MMMKYTNILPYVRRTPGLLRSVAPAIVRPSACALSASMSGGMAGQPYRIHPQRFFISSTARMAAEVRDEDALTLGERNVEPEKVAEITTKYASLKPYLNYDTWKALTGKPFNFEEMSVVQQRVLGLLPHLADPSLGDMPDGEGRDMLVKAKTGTGKTVAFLVPALERRLRAIRQTEKLQFTGPWRAMLEKERPDINLDDLDKHGKARLVRQFCYNTAGVLIISPTRELATQIANEAEKLCTHHRDVQVQLLVGGASRVQQLRQWHKQRPDIVVATPGRLNDLLTEERSVQGPLSALQTLIYDEADTLLDMGFRDEIERIVAKLPKAEDRLTMLFSATVSSDVRQIARKSLLPNHRFIDCVPKGEDNLHMNVPQHYTVVNNAEEQFAHLTRLIALDQLRNPGKSKVIVFCPTKSVTSLTAKRFDRRVDSLLDQLPAGNKTRTYELHSQIDSSKRFRVSDNFRQDRSGATILFTSDVSARGVDYPGTTQVIQIGIPSSPDIYIHRVGRTGRAGASGRADLLLQSFEQKFVQLELSKLPVKPISLDEVREEVAELARKFDEDRASVVPDDVWRSMESGSGANTVTRLRGAMLGKLGEKAVEDAVSRSTSNSDKEAVEEAFMSMLGYYASRSRELQSPIAKISEGLKDWAVSAGDLDRPPFVSDAFLQRLGTGFKERSEKRGGSGGSKDFGRSGLSNNRGGPRGFDRGGGSRDRADFSRGGRDGQKPFERRGRDSSRTSRGWDGGQSERRSSSGPSERFY